jgi:hypothetical protein
MDWQALLEQLIATVTTLAPELWRAARRQVAAETVSWGIWSIVLGVMAGISLWSITYAVRKDDENGRGDNVEWGMIAFVGIVTSVILVPLATGMFVGFVKRLISVDYYAIEMLIRLVTPS